MTEDLSLSRIEFTDLIRGSVADSKDELVDREMFTQRYVDAVFTLLGDPDRVMPEDVERVQESAKSMVFKQFGIETHLH